METLKANQVSKTDWFVAPIENSQSNNRYAVIRNIDTIDKDSETGEPCYGMTSEVDSEWVYKREAEERYLELTGRIKFGTKIGDEYKEIELPKAIVTEFGINCSPTYRRTDGEFKKWIKRGYVIADNMRYVCSYDTVIELKKIFKKQIASRGKYTQSKDKVSTRGYRMGARKATDWIYQLKKESQ